MEMRNKWAYLKTSNQIYIRLRNLEKAEHNTDELVQIDSW